jgi:hypothetical protein
VEVESRDLQRELCFDPRTGLLNQTTREVKLERWQSIAFEPDTSTAVPLIVGNTGAYLGLLPSPDTIEFVTKYAGYTTVGDKVVPAEIRRAINGKAIVNWKLVRIAPDPKPPFAPATFAVPDRYQLWAGCDSYQPPKFSKDFWRQAPMILSGATLRG